jgi:hypothetical protein
MSQEVTTVEELKSIFNQVYANIPLELRSTIVFVLDDQPITWNVAYLEILANSKNSPRILEGLRKLDLI